jgi:hypothetical protein
MNVVVYVVTAREDDVVDVCETYSTENLALGRGLQLAATYAGPGRVDLWESSPASQVWTDSTLRWIFMDTNKHTVQVVRCEVRGALLSVKDPASNVPPIHVPTPPPYDFMDRSLPAGWSLDGKPILMSDLLADPRNVRDPLTLTDAQKYALVTARIRKSPDYRSQPIRFFTYYQNAALRDLATRSLDAEELRDSEILSLQSLLGDLLSGVLVAT